MSEAKHWQITLDSPYVNAASDLAKDCHNYAQDPCFNHCPVGEFCCPFDQRLSCKKISAKDWQNVLKEV